MCEHVFAMQSLPSEIITHIGSFLDDRDRIRSLTLYKDWFFSIVPYLWSKVVCHTDHWEKFQKRFSRTRLLYSDYRSLIKTLHIISHSLQPIRLGFKLFLQGCSQLGELVLESPSLSNDDLFVLTTYCKNVTKLSVVVRTEITDDGLIAISHAKKLRHLMLKYLKNNVITEKGLLAIAGGFDGELRTFGLEYQDFREDLMETTFPEFAVADTMPMRSFAAAAVPDRPQEHYIDPQEQKKRLIDALCTIVRSHPHLERIALDWPVEDSLVLHEISRNVTNLVTFKVGNSSSMNELQQILRVNEKLERLTLYEINLMGLDIKEVLEPLRSSGTLRHLELHGVCQFVSIVEMIPSFCQLETLVFAPTTRLATMNPLTTISMDTIAQSCRNLRRVELPIHDNQSLISFATYCPLITVLGIQDGRAVDAHGLTIMATRLQLEYLHLGHSNVNEVAIQGIVKYQGPSLQHLVLPTPSRLTGPQFMAIAENCTHLRSLCNIGCEIPFPTLLNGVSQMAALQELGLGVRRGTPTISKAQMGILKQKCRSLRHISLYD
jgi:hypothetical protein